MPFLRLFCEFREHEIWNKKIRLETLFDHGEMITVLTICVRRLFIHNKFVSSLQTCFKKKYLLHLLLMIRLVLFFFFLVGVDELVSPAAHLQPILFMCQWERILQICAEQVIKRLIRLILAKFRAKWQCIKICSLETKLFLLKSINYINLLYYYLLLRRFPKVYTFKM